MNGDGLKSLGESVQTADYAEIISNFNYWTPFSAIAPANKALFLFFNTSRPLTWNKRLPVEAGCVH